MAVVIAPGGDRFELERSLIDASSLHRPDTGWTYTDANGHEHRWYCNNKPATYYRASNVYTTPTLRWMKDGEEYWDGDDEPHDVGHLECTQCGEHVQPGYTADSETQCVSGIAVCRINGEMVSKEEFTRRAIEAGLLPVGAKL